MLTVVRTMEEVKWQISRVMPRSTFCSCSCIQVASLGFSTHNPVVLVAFFASRIVMASAQRRLPSARTQLQPAGISHPSLSQAKELHGPSCYHKVHLTCVNLSTNGVDAFSRSVLQCEETTLGRTRMMQHSVRMHQSRARLFGRICSLEWERSPSQLRYALCENITRRSCKTSPSLPIWRFT